ncbi:MerR family transcriptional regulator [Brevibacterium album]|uniref:MerR family transcriptional regulator n=1 Tax=Brevibacterium album TaxID=417948 RepID=UPI000411D413|nr:MerR family transcriptional regulator [Brevibacterium album]
MRLSELAAAAGTTTASVKFYIRSGLLAPGVKRNQTTAVYGEHHRERLALILGVRERIGSSLAEIGALTSVIDDPEAGLLAVMEAAQTLAVGGWAGGAAEPAPESAPEPAPESAAGPVAGTASEPAPASASVSAVIEARGWPDADSEARRAAERGLARVRSGGASWSEEALGTIAEAVERIGTLGLDLSGSRERVALDVAVGTYELSRVVVDMLRLAQTSESIRRQLSTTPPAPTSSPFEHPAPSSPE